MEAQHPIKRPQHPLKQLPHVRTWIGADGKEHTQSIISQGFDARYHNVPVSDCPYDEKQDPDGRCWWTLGWHRADMHEQKVGRASLFSPKSKRFPPRSPGGPTLGIK
jgi:hypothetical protein